MGSLPDSRSVRTCTKHGIHTNHRARQLIEDDLRTFDYLLAMDISNLEDIEEIANGIDRSKDTRLGKGTILSCFVLIESAIVWPLSRAKL